MTQGHSPRDYPDPVSPVTNRSLPHAPARTRWFIAVGIWTLVFLVVWSLVRSESPSPLHNPAAEPRPVAPRNDLASDEQTTVAVFREASPSIVYITTIEYRRALFSLKVFEAPQGTGSGFIWDKDGHIVTNYHVIAGANAAEVTLADQSTWPARFVGGEPDTDLAVLKIEAPPHLLKPLVVGTSGDLQVGQKVLAIGNPFGFDQTLTTGIVSALGRVIEAMNGRKIRDVIQTDAAINPGNSGGPLLDSAGRLIGVNTQIASPSGASAGIGFAVPVDTVNDIVPDLIRYGRVRRAQLGVVLIEDWKTRRLGIRGCLISTVDPNGGAAQAGLRGTVVDHRGYVRRFGDIIVKIDDHEVETLNGLRDALEPHEAGDEVHVTYLRDETAVTATVKLKYLN